MYDIHEYTDDDDDTDDAWVEHSMWYLINLFNELNERFAKDEYQCWPSKQVGIVFD